MHHVFVLNATKKVLMPTHPARARALLCLKKAAVYRKYPFTIILLVPMEVVEFKTISPRTSMSEPDDEPIAVMVSVFATIQLLVIVKAKVLLLIIRL